MKPPLALQLLAVAATACIPRYTAKWPLRGPMIEIVNATAEELSVAARDGQGRTFPIAQLDPGERTCRPWPFVHERGELVTETRGGTVASPSFYPWAYHSWRWEVGGELEIVRVCGT
ncbi:MAG TPA: hypothetical protein VNI61_08220 [Gemmatimonadales bacterium]|nr:hypothetical protein [Gemmatimonadales bacterium]